jgi:hypothetical protein
MSVKRKVTVPPGSTVIAGECKVESQ